MIEENWQHRIRGVVFDAVGTLIDPDPPVVEVYRAAALRQGIELDGRVIRDRFRRWFGDDEAEPHRDPLATDEGVEARRWRRIVGGCLPELPDPERAFEELWGHFGRPTAWRAYPDAGPALLALAKAGIGVRVASNFDGRLRPVLRGLGPLSGLAETVVISSEVGRRKPHPDFYRASCESLGLEGRAVLYVGDEVENDVRGPREAGLSAVLIDRRGGAPVGIPSIRSLAELVEWLPRNADHC
jgi:putative hydrolase of the HAD superfamily